MILVWGIIDIMVFLKEKLLCGYNNNVVDLEKGNESFIYRL